MDYSLSPVPRFEAPVQHAPRPRGLEAAAVGSTIALIAAWAFTGNLWMGLGAGIAVFVLVDRRDAITTFREGHTPDHA